jgi:hypothetical protein
MESSAALSWQNQFHRIVSQSFGLPEYDEIWLLNRKTRALRKLRKSLVSEKFD